jgi:hypothetical protein
MLGTLGSADKSAGLRRQQKKQQQFHEMGTGSHDMVRISPFCWFLRDSVSDDRSKPQIPRLRPDDKDAQMTGKRSGFRRIGFLACV